MKAKKRRSTVCHNCGSPLEEHYNFCPVCGQSNSDNNITFWVLIKEFVDNYLGLDSKMAHSFLPFLFSPGSLTNRFQEGKIKHFIHPVRLYLVMSLFYFFTISYLLSGINFSSIEDAEYKGNVDLEELVKDNRLKLLSDSAKFALVRDTVKAQYPNITDFKVFYDSLLGRFGNNFGDREQVNIDDITVPPPVEMPRIEKLHMYARDMRISDKAFMDSLSNGNTNEMNLWPGADEDHIRSQIRKIFKNEEGFKGFLLGNLPLMMFILIPLFAGVLKMIYIRRTHLYIKHIVHALHVHSFAYLMYGLSLLVIFKLVGDEAWRGIIAGVVFIGVSTYVYVSFIRVYKQHWFKTLIKFNIVGFTYSIFLNIFFWLEVVISFWYYQG